MEKPAIDIPCAWFVFLCGGLCLALGLTLVFFSIRGCLNYLAAENRAVTLTAQVYDVEKTTDVDNDVYDVYVQYEFQGEQHKIRYVRSTHSDWLDRIGEPVEITVDSRYPEVQLKDKVDAPFFLMFFGAPLTSAGFLLVTRRIRYSYVEWHGMTDEACRMDCIDNYRRPGFGTTGMVMLGVAAICGGFGFMVDGLFATVMIFSLGGLIVMLIFKIKQYKLFGQMTKVAPLRTVYLVVDKRIGSDFECRSEYELCLQCAGKSSWVKVTKPKYNQIGIGDQLHSVRFGAASVEYAVDSATGNAIML